jgi:hypothetical protein
MAGQAGRSPLDPTVRCGNAAPGTPTLVIGILGGRSPRRRADRAAARGSLWGISSQACRRPCASSPAASRRTPAPAAAGWR